MVPHQEICLKKAQRQEAQKWLSFLLQGQTLTGWPVAHAFDSYFAALAGWCGPNVTQAQIMRVLQEMLSRKETSLTQFESLIRKDTDAWDYSQENSKRVWTFAVPLKLGFVNSNGKGFRFLG